MTDQSTHKELRVTPQCDALAREHQRGGIDAKHGPAELENQLSTLARDLDVQRERSRHLENALHRVIDAPDVQAARRIAVDAAGVKSSAPAAPSSPDREGLPESAGRGTVTVTCNEDGDAVAVTRTDDEGRILSVIWERANQTKREAYAVPLTAAAQEALAAIGKALDAEVVDRRALDHARASLDFALAKNPAPNEKPASYPEIPDNSTEPTKAGTSPCLTADYLRGIEDAAGILDDEVKNAREMAAEARAEAPLSNAEAIERCETIAESAELLARTIRGFKDPAVHAEAATHSQGQCDVVELRRAATAVLQDAKWLAQRWRGKEAAPLIVGVGGLPLPSPVHVQGRTRGIADGYDLVDPEKEN